MSRSNVGFFQPVRMPDQHSNSASYETSENSVIKASTPHLFMWFCNGKKNPSITLPLPTGEKINYYNTLKIECEKLLSSNTPVYLVYKGSFLTENQKSELDKLSEKEYAVNLFVIDYDDVETAISDLDGLSMSSIRSKVTNYCEAFLKCNFKEVGLGGIADVVDMTRLVLLAYCDVLKNKALEKYAAQTEKCIILLKSAPGIIYRDFDVILQSSMEDISLPEEAMGFLSSTNFNERMKEDFNERMKVEQNKRIIPEKNKSQVEIFFDNYIWDKKRYLELRSLWRNKKINEESYKNFQTEAEKIGGFGASDFGLVRLENSLLCVNRPKHPFIVEAVKQVFIENQSPYAAIQRAVRGKIDFVKFGLEYAESSLFFVGNDYTWNEKGMDNVSYNGDNFTSYKSLPDRRFG